jgi:hypothetical protein
MVHCGVCSACLLRRTAAFAADLTEPENTYLWANLGAQTLWQAIHPDSNRCTRKNDVDIANHGVLAMTELANKADAAPDDTEIAQCVFEIANGGQMNVIAANLRRLLEAHKSEWAQFRKHFGPKSWINSHFACL